MKLIIDIHEDEYALCKKQWDTECLDTLMIAVKYGTSLDNLRAEIMQLDYDIEDVDYDCNDMAQTEMMHMICREEVLQIIDKYRAESEDNK